MKINFLKEATVDQTLESLKILGLDTYEDYSNELNIEENEENEDNEDNEYIVLEESVYFYNNLAESFNNFIQGEFNYSKFINDYLIFASHFSSQYEEDSDIGEQFIDGYFTCSLNVLLKCLDYLEGEGVIKIEY